MNPNTSAESLTSIDIGTQIPITVEGGIDKAVNTALKSERTSVMEERIKLDAVVAQANVDGESIIGNAIPRKIKRLSSSVESNLEVVQNHGEKLSFGPSNENGLTVAHDYMIDAFFAGVIDKETYKKFVDFTREKTTEFYQAEVDDYTDKPYLVNKAFQAQFKKGMIDLETFAGLKEGFARDSYNYLLMSNSVFFHSQEASDPELLISHMDGIFQTYFETGYFSKEELEEAKQHFRNGAPMTKIPDHIQKTYDRLSKET